MRSRHENDPAAARGSHELHARRDARERHDSQAPRAAAADPHDPAACPDWWSEPGALPTGASELRHVPPAYRQPGMMRRAAECRGGPVPREDGGAAGPDRTRPGRGTRA
ncbi:hypothetical protein ACVCIC_12620 [Burkholderia glumae]|uniref:Uncharacterized protein n=1 Tax=Burkholderia glumae TaxID=337 RepID=A0ABY5B7D9_BURGL|nr:hypothetical protein [Burkholderia glumae]AJY62643.1 hypothetical protein KS03_3605 [Burkholderia glumae LMG 2196 = ATCC 33617]KHJ60089.1 hypothetical protein NCPPB3923_25880 [Burkholderia glumae]MCM2494522.1 hypothetical protein [Burkholderia glumae]MCM2545431.1 hypothetical protein [Burkholderia glumae]MCM2551252.1 hypothetical protein [Burkholderia glumae]